MELNRKDLRKIIYYGWMRGLNASAIANEMCESLGENIVTSRTCLNWITKFNAGDFDVNENERSGRPSIDGVDERIEECLIENRHATCREIASYLNCSKDTVCNHMHKLGKKYLAFQWIPHQLSLENKNNRVRISAENLERYRRNNFLNQLVTVDEIWIYWDNEGNKPGTHHRAWRGSGDDTPMVCKHSNMTPRKHLAIVFWDAKGVILFKTLDRNKTINAEVYCNSLDELKDALWEKRRRRTENFNNIHFLHDNARPHTAHATQAKLADLDFTVLPHPPYSPDLAPSDYYLFSPLKAGLKGRNFANKNEVNEAIQTWIDQKPQEFFHVGIHSLPGRWQKCITSEGNYFSGMKDNDD